MSSGKAIELSVSMLFLLNTSHCLVIIVQLAGCPYDFLEALETLRVLLHFCRIEDVSRRLRYTNWPVLELTYQRTGVEEKKFSWSKREVRETRSGNRRAFIGGR